MKLKARNFKYLFILTAVLFCFSCKKDDLSNNITDEIYEANTYIYKITNTYYLWSEYIPSDIDINNYPNPVDLFDAMYYPTLDHWSFVAEDYQEILNSINGIEKMSGVKIKLFHYPTGKNVYAILEYVYKNSPAANAGLKRGDIFIKINNQIIDTTNYTNLFNQESMQVGLGKMVGGNIVDLNTTVNLTKVEMSINPVLDYKVIEVGGKKIGYLLYDQFIETYYTDLVNAISYLKSQNINEMVLDLRFNPGGYLSTCKGLASMLVPSSALDKVFLTKTWNTQVTNAFLSYYGKDSEYFKIYFDQPSVNLNLSRLVVLTSDGTASASEEIINGLKPYMNVITIGGTTVGKYTGAVLFYDDTSSSNMWGVYLVVNKLANANGITDYINGFTPNYPVDDDYTTPLGDQTEPLLAKAIEVLTGTSAKKAQKSVELKPFTRIYSDPFKKNGIMITDINLQK